jgi:predicted transcriptional regulator
MRGNETRLKALPPSEWRIMYMLWRHGPLTVAEVHKLSLQRSPELTHLCLAEVIQ